MAQKLVSSPIFGEFYCGPAQIAVVLLQLRFEAAEEGERVGCGAGKSGHNFVVVQATDLLGGMLDHRFAEGDLAVAGKYDGSIAADGQNCRRSNQSFRRHERNC